MQLNTNFGNIYSQWHIYWTDFEKPIMKTMIVLLLAMVALASCYSPREIQVDIVSAQLVRIDTVFRYTNDKSQQLLTWRDNENIEYISYVPLQANYTVGTRMAVLRKR